MRSDLNTMFQGEEEVRAQVTTRFRHRTGIGLRAQVEPSRTDECACAGVQGHPATGRDDLLVEEGT
jgi:hypothetical protein